MKRNIERGQISVTSWPATTTSVSPDAVQVRVGGQGPGCARVFATALLARLPQGMSTLAILLLVRESTHSYPAAGAAVGGYALACAAAVPVQGRLVDRFGRGGVLFPVAIAQAIVLASLVIVAQGGAPAAALVALATAGGAMQPAIAPSVRALLGEMVTDPTTRGTAYALESVVQELIWITGPLVVALVITLLAPSGAVLVSAGVCVLGTTLFIASPRVRANAGTRSAERVRSAVRSRELRAMLGRVAMMGASIGLIDVGIPALALHAGSRASTGVLLALWSVGSLCGGLWYGGISWRLPLSDRYRWLLTAAVACVVPLVFARTIPEGNGRKSAGGRHDRARVLLPVRARGPLGQRGLRDRGVHVGCGGADGGPGGRLGAERCADRRHRPQRPVRRGVRGDGGRGTRRRACADAGAGSG